MDPTSPLSEAEAYSLDELMSRDPIQLRKTSDAEFAKLIEILIAQRHAHEAGKKKPQKPAKKPPSIKPEQLTLDDLLHSEDNTK